MSEAEAVHVERVELERAKVAEIAGCLALAGFSVRVPASNQAESGAIVTPGDLIEAGDSFCLVVECAATRERAGHLELIPGNGDDVLHDFGWRETPAGLRMRAALEARGF